MVSATRNGVLILGIETSCDETAAAVVESGERLLSNAVSSQIAVHNSYGGVVPELASREHLRAVVPVVRKALADAGCAVTSIDALAVTQGPGLAGALLTGIAFAKATALALDKPLIAVNHLEGHIHSVLLEKRQSGQEPVQFPLLALVVSGGHTHLFLAQETSKGWNYRDIGHTLDDAAGEAFDKVAKLLGLGYPGGPILDALAPYGNPGAIRFPPAQIRLKRGQVPNGRFDFSFSGIKTAVLRYVELQGMRDDIAARSYRLEGVPVRSGEAYLEFCDRRTLDVIASFQRAVIRDLAEKTFAAARAFDAQTLFVTGGVAANSELRIRFEEQAGREGILLAFPSRPLATDNAAMIAAAAYPRFVLRDFVAPEFSADPSLRLH